MSNLAVAPRPVIAWEPLVLTVWLTAGPIPDEARIICGVGGCPWPATHWEPVGTDRGVFVCDGHRVWDPEEG